MNQKILDILKDIKPDEAFEESSDFIEDGLLDSFDIVTLVGDLENEFSIVVSALDIRPQFFTSIASIGALVEKSAKR